MAEQQEQQTQAQTAATGAAAQAGEEGAKGTSIESVEQKEVSAPAERRMARPRPRGIESTPFSMMRHYIDEMDRMISSIVGGRSPLSAMTPLELIASGGWVPAIETFEQDGKLVFRAELPGLRPEDVQVEIMGNDLLISGERLHEARETEGGGFYSERQYGCFERRIPLPEGCNAENIEATFDDGVLTVSIAGPGKPEGKKIEVKSKSAQEQTEQRTEGEVH